MVDQELSFRKQQSGFRNQSVRINLFKHIRKECRRWDHWRLPGFFLWKPKIIQIEQREYMHLEHLPFFHIYCISQGTGGSCGHEMQFYQGAVTLAILAAGNLRAAPFPLSQGPPSALPVWRSSRSLFMQVLQLVNAVVFKIQESMRAWTAERVLEEMKRKNLVYCDWGSRTFCTLHTAARAKIYL